MIRWIKAFFKSKKPIIDSVVDFTKIYSHEEFQERFRYCVVCDRELDWTPQYTPIKRWSCHSECGVGYYRVCKDERVVDVSVEGFSYLLLSIGLAYNHFVVLGPKSVRMVVGSKTFVLKDNPTTIDVKKFVKEDLDKYLVLM